jgi:prolyl 4-hydroxylase
MMRSAAALALLFSQSVFAVEYGVDVSYPMHHPNVTTNFASLPHNLDPSLPTPPEFEGMPVQPLGDKQSFYQKLIDGCVEFYDAKGKGDRCIESEAERVKMSLRQPQSMVVSGLG